MSPPDVLRAARRQAVSVSVATGLYGVSFGALSVASGLDVAQTMALSLLLFSGGSQFALIGVLGAGGAVGAAVASAALLGARNALYGAQLAPLLALPASALLPAAQLTIDESTAVATAQPDRTAARVGFWWTGGGVFVLWNLFTLVGALAGDRLGDPRVYGLDAAAAAAFLALVWPRLGGPQGRTARLVAAAAVLVALATTPVVPAGVPVLLAAAVAILVGVLSPALPAVPLPGDDADAPDDDAADDAPAGGPAGAPDPGRPAP
ncbi:AzlC family ABC transporter permease [Cellulomonas sp. 179-A 9B4 NHS]|uniref:AzlC family ABC transporter permease n=1 Tax=Cellulomonas sp. 179-A 9B4 NHS TaxID=3142379 RepID=UPI0039A32D7F